MTVNGALAGLVSITAGCAFVSVGAAVIIGLVGGILVVCAARLFDLMMIDDPVGALPVHLICGIWGTLALGLFASTTAPGGLDQNGLLYGGSITFLTTQAIGIATVGVFTFATSFVCWKVVDKLVGIRVVAQVESEGLDGHEMGMLAYPAERLLDLTEAVEKSHLGNRKPQLRLLKGEEEEEVSNFAYSVESSFAFELENVEVCNVMNTWREFCGDASADEKYSEAYKYFTTVDDKKISFRGGLESEIYKVIYDVALRVSPQAEVYLVSDKEPVRRVS
jgi:hypothetical protein